MDLSIGSNRNKLIVLVPDSLAGNVELARKIYWMAIRDHCDVLYLALIDDTEKMLTAARSMVTMRAITAGNSLNVNSEVVQTDLWLKTLQEVYQPGDHIVCHQEQSVRRGTLKTESISEFLHDVLNIPTITVSGFYHPQKEQLHHWLHSFTAWVGFLLILVVFSTLEIQLGTLFQTLIGKAFLCILVVVEIGVIWAWESLIG